ncbi:MAG TPA: hypothetical protein VG847_14520 [Chitinophagaceae bacterium]|nr:hypothetical protein [Chitinophagaceae bacterium]
MKKVATIESIGSSTRIEGSKLSDKEVEALLSNPEIQNSKPGMNRKRLDTHPL